MFKKSRLSQILQASPPEFHRATELVRRVHYDLASSEPFDVNFRERVTYLKELAADFDRTFVLQVLSLQEDAEPDDSSDPPWQDWNYAIEEIVASWCVARKQAATETLLPGLGGVVYRELVLQATARIVLQDDAFSSRLFKEIGELVGKPSEYLPLNEEEVRCIIWDLRRLWVFIPDAKDCLIALRTSLADKFASQVEYANRMLGEMLSP